MWSLSWSHAATWDVFLGSECTAVLQHTGSIRCFHIGVPHYRASAWVLASVHLKQTQYLVCYRFAFAVCWVEGRRKEQPLWGRYYYTISRRQFLAESLELELMFLRPFLMPNSFIISLFIQDQPLADLFCFWDRKKKERNPGTPVFTSLSVPRVCSVSITSWRGRCLLLFPAYLYVRLSSCPK